LLFRSITQCSGLAYESEWKENIRRNCVTKPDAHSRRLRVPKSMLKRTKSACFRRTLVSHRSIFIQMCVDILVSIRTQSFMPQVTECSIGHRLFVPQTVWHRYRHSRILFSPLVNIDAYHFIYILIYFTS
jgi:hypothetical protein